MQSAMRSMDFATQAAMLTPARSESPDGDVGGGAAKSAPDSDLIVQRKPVGRAPGATLQSAPAGRAIQRFGAGRAHAVQRQDDEGLVPFGSRSGILDAPPRSELRRVIHFDQNEARDPPRVIESALGKSATSRHLNAWEETAPQEEADKFDGLIRELNRHARLVDNAVGPQVALLKENGILDTQGDVVYEQALLEELETNAAMSTRNDSYVSPVAGAAQASNASEKAGQASERAGDTVETKAEEEGLKTELTALGQELKAANADVEEERAKLKREEAESKKEDLEGELEKKKKVIEGAAKAIKAGVAFCIGDPKDQVGAVLDLLEFGANVAVEQYYEGEIDDIQKEITKAKATAAEHRMDKLVSSLAAVGTRLEGVRKQIALIRAAYEKRKDAEASSYTGFADAYNTGRENRADIMTCEQERVMTEQGSPNPLSACTPTSQQAVKVLYSNLAEMRDIARVYAPVDRGLVSGPIPLSPWMTDSWSELPREIQREAALARGWGTMVSGIGSAAEILSGSISDAVKANQSSKRPDGYRQAAPTASPAPQPQPNAGKKPPKRKVSRSK